MAKNNNNNKTNQRSNKGKPNCRSNSRARKGSNNRNSSRNDHINKIERDVESDMNSEGHNDFEWINKNPELLKDASSINTTNRTGYKLPMTVGGAFTKFDVPAVPGIMSLLFYPHVPCYGNSSSNADPTDPANLCALNTYSFYRHANSGSVNYDAPDLFMGIQAAGEAFAAFFWGKRAYDTYNIYNQRNRYVPQAIIQAQGFNYNSIAADPAKFRTQINIIAAKMSVLWVPKNLPFIKRLCWMCSNIYTDSTSAKSQLYMFTPGGFHKFNPKTENTGSSLSMKTINYNSTGLTTTQWFDYMNDLISELISDEDMGIMFGDMLKAYGAENIFTVAPVPENSAILPVHNAEVLAQIMNSTAIGANAANVSQTGNGVIYNSIQSAPLNATPLSTSVLLNFWEENPDYKVVAESTRFTSLFEIQTSGTSSYVGTPICTTAYISNYRIWYYSNNSLTWINFTNTVNNASPELTLLLSALSMFDWHPQVWGYDQGEGNANNTVTRLFYDIDNYTSIGLETLKRLQEVCSISEYNVPIQV